MQPFALTRLLLLLAYLAFACGSAMAAPCDSLPKKPPQDKSKSVIGQIADILWHQEVDRPAQSADRTLYFTSVDGFSRQPICEGNRIWGNYLYYPIGLIVQETSVKESINGVPYDLVETEYGLLIYIAENNLQAIDPTRTYFFANGLTGPIYCTAIADCRSRDPKQKKRLVPGGRWGRYAASDSLVRTCAPVSVLLYDAGGHRVDTSAGTRWPQHLLPCLDNEDEGTQIDSPNTKMDANLKIVTDAKYRDFFQKPMRLRFSRIPSSVLGSVFPGVEDKKDCQESLTEETKSEAGGGAGIKIPIYVAELSGTVTGSYLRKRIKELGPNTYIFYSSYEVGADGSSKGYFVSVGDVYPIMTVLSCGLNKEDEHKLILGNFYSIEVHNAGLPNGLLTIAAGPFKEIFISQDPENKKSYSSWKETGVDARRRGQLWKVENYESYFRLRDAMRGYIDEQTLLYEPLEEADDPTYRRYVDYFAHLILAATVEWRKPRG